MPQKIVHVVFEWVATDDCALSPVRVGVIVQPGVEVAKGQLEDFGDGAVCVACCAVEDGKPVGLEC